MYINTLDDILDVLSLELTGVSAITLRLRSAVRSVWCLVFDTLVCFIFPFV